jgi:tRNA pseudouridine55 synthase
MSHVPKYVVLEKSVGQTPLEAIRAWQSTHPEFANVPATYAGRLDPMASGKLLVLLGDECKKRDAYAKLDKEYVIEVVLGARTDTGDALGLAKLNHERRRASEITTKEIECALASLTGSHTVPYPAFSSKPVVGRPLFMYALEGTLDTISIPTHTETIYALKLLALTHVSGSELYARIQEILKKAPTSDDPRKVLGADFRQHEIRAKWEQVLASAKDFTFPVLTLRVTCASGTYMRTFAERLGSALGTHGFALSIRRTKIGSYQKVGP